MKVSCIICGAVGVAVGAGVTYLIASTEIKRSEEEKREAEIEEMRNYYLDKVNALEEKMQEKDKAIEEAIEFSKKCEKIEENDGCPPEDVPTVEEAEEVVKDEDYIPKTSLKGGTYPAKKKKTAKKEKEKKEVPTVKDTRRLSSAITLVSDRDFDEEEDFCKVSLVWNPVSLILWDEDGTEADIDTTISEDALDHFGDYMPEKVFVRNENSRCVYEVTRDEDWEG